MIYRNKPKIIQAFRLGEEGPDWFADAVTANRVTTHNTDGRWSGGPDYALIKTLEGEMRADRGDYIIRGIVGELYPCKADIFAASYEPVTEEPLELTPEMAAACAAEAIHLFTTQRLPKVS